MWYKLASGVFWVMSVIFLYLKSLDLAIYNILVAIYFDNKATK